MLTFFAQDHATSDMAYSNADITKAEQAAEIAAFADYWNHATGSGPGLLVFDSQLTTCAVLDELSGRGITWLTLRQRGKTGLARLDALPAAGWKTYTVARPGRYRKPRIHEDIVKLSGIGRILIFTSLIMITASCCYLWQNHRSWRDFLRSARRRHRRGE